jgi:hypothetical protein
VSNSTRRKAERVDLRFPVKLITPSTFAEAQAEDLSRTGVRLRLSAVALGLGPLEDPAEAARQVAGVLANFAVNLDHHKLGPLLPRHVKLTRVGLPADAPGMLELCCAFREPLGDDEAAILQAELPPLDESVAAWSQESDLPNACEGQVSFDDREADLHLPPPPPPAPGAPVAPLRPGVRAFVASSLTEGPPSVFCHADLVTTVAVRVQMPRDEGLASRAHFTATGAARCFVERFGEHVDLRLVNGAGDAWTGTVRVSGVELPTAAPELMMITLAFDRRLRPSELRGLGIHKMAA